MKHFIVNFFALALIIFSFPSYTGASPGGSETQIGKNSNSTQVFENTVVRTGSVVRRNQQQSVSSSVKIVTPRGHGTGSYIKIEKNYYVLTAGHVLAGNGIVGIQTESGIVYGEVVFVSETHDIGLVKIPRLTNREDIRYRNSSISDFNIGEEVVYSGYPGGFEIFTSGGEVSGYSEGRRIMLHGFAWPGSSGSGVIDSTGKVRGVVIAVGIGQGFVPQLLETVIFVELLTEEVWQEIEAALNRE